MIFGASYNFNEFIGACINNKTAQACLDFFMLSAWAIMYFCVVLAYKNGEYRFVDSFVTIISMLVYFVALYKPLAGVLNKFGGKLNRMIKTVSEKLKFGKKSFKKLLHLYK